MSSNFSLDETESKQVTVENVDSKAHSPIVDLSSKIPTADTLYIWNLSKTIDREYVDCIEDIIRMVTIQFIIQIMYFMRQPSASPLFSASFFELIFYIVLGVSFYWLVLRKIVRIL